MEHIRRLLSENRFIKLNECFMILIRPKSRPINRPTGKRAWGPYNTIISDNPVKDQFQFGDIRIGDGKIRTENGNFSPTIVDLGKRNGWERIAEIREAVRNEEFKNWLELVFLPLYGKETGDERSEMGEHVLRFESELYKAKKLPATLLAAALIMSNKFVAKDRLRALWEEIKMLDIDRIVAGPVIRTMGVFRILSGQKCPQIGLDQHLLRLSLNRFTRRTCG